MMKSLARSDKNQSFSEAPKLGTQKQLADMIGVNEKYVSRLIAKNDPRIILVRNGKKRPKVNLTLSAKNYNDSPGPRKDKQKVTPPHLRNLNALEIAEEAQKAAEERNALEKKKLKEQHRKLKLENDIKEEKLVDAAQTKTVVFELARKTRDAMLQVPGRTASLCMNKSAHEIEIMLTEEIKKALFDLTKDLKE
jgi:hypothetical protein